MESRQIEVPTATLPANESDRPGPARFDAEFGHLYPFRPHRIAIDGPTMHYVDSGPDGRTALLEWAHPTTDQTLLFVHGNPTWSFHWRQLILGLNDRFRCVAPDHLGCGRSDQATRPLRLDHHIDNLGRLVDALDLQDVTLVAQDWGGAIGLGAMLARRDRLRRIVLFNTGAFPPWYMPWQIGICRIPVFGRLALKGANAFSLAATRLAVARSRPLNVDVVRGYLAPYHNWTARSAVYDFVQDIPRGPQHPTWQTLVDIEAGLGQLADLPVLLIWGMRDWCFTPACLDRFLQHWPQAEVHRLDDVGHWVVEDAPQESLDLLQEFLLR